MTNEINLSELKRAINLAEEMLEDLKTKEIRKLKQKRIKRALKKAYALLNSKGYSQKQVDKVTRIVYRSMLDRVGIFWFYIFGLFLAGALMFTSYEAYSFIKANWDLDHYIKPEDAVSSVVKITYKNTNIVDLHDLISVSNETGLKNPKQEFNISNTAELMPYNMNYNVKYQITIRELNDTIDKVLDKRFIRYQLTHYDAETGIRTTEPIRTFADLTKNIDGSYKMFTGTQAKDRQTNFEVVIWIGEDALNDQQGREYRFAFSVVAVVTK